MVIPLATMVQKGENRMSDFFDGKRLVDGYLHGNIVLQDAIYYCQHHRDTAKYFFSDLFIKLFTNPVNTKEMNLKDAQATPAWRLLNLYRFSFDLPQTVQLCLSFHYPLVAHFLDDMLIALGDKFADEHLEPVKNNFPRPDIIQKIERQHQLRLGKKISVMRQNPTEINRDVQAVMRRITDYGFTPALNELLQKIDDELAADGDDFDQSGNLKHIRTFMEHLHDHVGKELGRRKPELADGTDLSSFGQAIDYLNRKTVVTEKMKLLAKAIYGVLSNEGVHSLTAKKEYVRLCRNMAIEYAIVLFFELEQRLNQ